MRGYSAEELEEALSLLWTTMENRLTEGDLKKLGVNQNDPSVKNIFDELCVYGPGGPLGFGLGRMIVLEAGK